jgi:hypothetical protein
MKPGTRIATGAAPAHHHEAACQTLVALMWEGLVLDIDGKRWRVYEVGAGGFCVSPSPTERSTDSPPASTRMFSPDNLFGMQLLQT